MIDMLAMLILLFIFTVLGVSAVIKLPDYQEGGHDKIVACEKKLTREHHCVLIAVPEEQGKK